MSISSYGHGGHGGGHGGGGQSEDDDDRSTQSSIGMATCDENFTSDHQQFNDAIQGGRGGEGTDNSHYRPPINNIIGGGGGTNNTTNNDYILDEDNINNDDDNYDDDNDDAATIEAMDAVSTEHQVLKTENIAKLQTILASVKKSTKMILREMETYLHETEEVEKTYIQCRANTQKEQRRMEGVEPDVLAATQSFIDQGAAQQLFGGGGGGGMNFMNMTALFGRGGGGNGVGGGGGGNADDTPLRMRTASNDVAAVSTAGSSIHGSIG